MKNIRVFIEYFNLKLKELIIQDLDLKKGMNFKNIVDTVQHLSE